MDWWKLLKAYIRTGGPVKIRMERAPLKHKPETKLLEVTLKKKELCGLSPQANYTDWERLPIFGEVSANFLRFEGVAWSAQRILGFLDRSRYFFFQAAPQLYSRGWVDPVPDPLLLRKSGSAGNRTRTSRPQRRPVTLSLSITIRVQNGLRHSTNSFPCLIVGHCIHSVMLG
jgi:hypothetical protein